MAVASVEARPGAPARFTRRFGRKGPTEFGQKVKEWICVRRDGKRAGDIPVSQV